MTVVPQSLPTVISGWGKSFNEASIVKGFFYDESTDFLYTQTPTNQFNVFLNVPSSAGQGFVYTNDPDGFYATILSGYSRCLLKETCGLLLTEDGKILVI